MYGDVMCVYGDVIREAVKRSKTRATSGLHSRECRGGDGGGAVEGGEQGWKAAPPGAMKGGREERIAAMKGGREERIGAERGGWMAP